METFQIIVIIISSLTYIVLSFLSIRDIIISNKLDLAIRPFTVLWLAITTFILVLALTISVYPSLNNFIS